MPALGRNHPEKSSQFWPGLAEPRAGEVRLTEMPVDHPGQGCPTGLTVAHSLHPSLAPGTGVKVEACISWQGRGWGRLGKDHLTRRVFVSPEASGAAKPGWSPRGLEPLGAD